MSRSICKQKLDLIRRFLKYDYEKQIKTFSKDLLKVTHTPDNFFEYWSSRRYQCLDMLKARNNKIDWMQIRALSLYFVWHGGSVYELYKWFEPWEDEVVDLKLSILGY